MKKIVTLSLLTLSLSGCMSGNAKRFFAENKGYTFKKCTVSLSTPWGTEVISADEITSTVVYPLGATNGPLIIPAGSKLATETSISPAK